MLITWLKQRRKLRELPEAIARVARLVDDRPAFEAEAKDVAVRFGAPAVAVLWRRLRQPTRCPPEFDFPNARLGEWNWRWHFAIFEVCYHLREPALEFVRETAFGPYDWPQGNAIEILCRWAAERFERDRSLRDLRLRMPDMRAEAIDYAVGPLLNLARDNAPLADVLNELRSVPVFDESYLERRSTVANEPPTH